MKHTTSFAVGALVAILSGFAPCGAQSAHESHDSAGVVITTTTPNRVAPTWRIGNEPLLTIGEIDGDQPYLLTNIWNALRTPDGLIIVVEESSYEVRIFGPDGRHMQTFGRRGGGPKEFGGPPWIALSGPDTLVVWDPAFHRLSRYALNGEMIRQDLLRPSVMEHRIGTMANGLVWQIAGDGTLLWHGPGPSQRVSQGVINSTKRVVLLPSDGRIVDFGVFVDGQTYYTANENGGSSGTPSPFGRTHIVALGSHSDRVAISHPALTEVQIFDAQGRLTKLWRVREPRTAVSRTMVADARREFLEMAARMSLPTGRAGNLFDGIPVPDSVPAIGALIWDRVGNLWIGNRVGRLQQIQGYDVLDGGGRWLGAVSLASASQSILDIGDDYILVKDRDVLGVVYLKLYELIRLPRSNPK